jgi:hypothetical protein
MRRRLRRRVRSRPFTNARTATRSFDLPLAIGDPSISFRPVLPNPLSIGGFRPVHGGHSGGFLCMVPVTPLYIAARRGGTAIGLWRCVERVGRPRSRTQRRHWCQAIISVVAAPAVSLTLRNSRLDAFADGGGV